ncbi:hypothetical protein GCM10010981_11240 [Dyella nitratireducens]|uniref:Transposase DDE domain-containing protein n=1 Tax=Dyella nitratireducens TaxID=1849580 RepID=A0ABQ1FNX1_9GAMM|nr:hypothetical protein GCM10010981_11240 [Dyella nitratireducens]GLQ43813.1 hypothetical protein GCM10007902_36630 [Dyella nitratireducens]
MICHALTDVETFANDRRKLWLSRRRTPESSQICCAQHTKPFMKCAVHVILDWIPAFAGMTIRFETALA